MAASKIIAACLILASQNYAIPPAVLVGIYKAEGGKVGQEVANKNGSFDLGPMQINTIWMPELADEWGVSEQVARKLVRDDPCTNVNVAAWILKNHLTETQNLTQAVAHYHSRTPEYGTKYKKRVMSIMKENGLVRSDN
jgi:soluble lytic murein transglycosylase-like protein